MKSNLLLKETLEKKLKEIQINDALEVLRLRIIEIERLEELKPISYLVAMDLNEIRRSIRDLQQHIEFLINKAEEWQSMID